MLYITNNAKVLILNEKLKNDRLFLNIRHV